MPILTTIINNFAIGVISANDGHAQLCMSVMHNSYTRYNIATSTKLLMFSVLKFNSSKSCYPATKYYFTTKVARGITVAEPENQEVVCPEYFKCPDG